MLFDIIDFRDRNIGRWLDYPLNIVTSHLNCTLKAILYKAIKYGDDKKILHAFLSSPEGFDFMSTISYLWLLDLMQFWGCQDVVIDYFKKAGAKLSIWRLIMTEHNIVDDEIIACALRDFRSWHDLNDVCDIIRLVLTPRRLLDAIRNFITLVVRSVEDQIDLIRIYERLLTLEPRLPDEIYDDVFNALVLFPLNTIARVLVRICLKRGRPDDRIRDVLIRNHFGNETYYAALFEYAYIFGDAKVMAVLLYSTCPEVEPFRKRLLEEVSFDKKEVDDAFRDIVQEEAKRARCMYSNPTR